MPKEVLAVVVTYNRKWLLKECLEALLNQSYKNMDICVIDNASDDGTYDLLKDSALMEKIIYKNTKRNIGGAGGFNLGIKYAVKKNYNFVWVMDDDTIPEVDSLENLMNTREYIGNDFGFLASCVLWTDGSFCKMNNPGIKKEMLYDKEYQHVKQGIMNIHHASFVSILIPTTVVKDVGLPIKEFFIWKDDYEYTSRISEKYKCYFVSKSVVIHKMKNNMLPNIVTDATERLGRYVYEYRNEYYLVRKQGGKAKLYYYYNALCTLVSIIKDSKDCKWKRIYTMVNGIIKGWYFKPSIERVK